VIVDSKGNIYTTDSNTPGVYRIPAGGSNLEIFVGPEYFRSPQGLCLSSDQKTLFVADYSRGVFAIDVESKAVHKLQSPATAVISGIDGLYAYQNSLIATQNGVTPNRVLQIFLDSSLNKIESVKILESNNKIFGEPTLAVIAKDSLFYVANSQFGKYLEDDKIQLNPPIILKLKL
jgi:DNA-binding beta-propeller fold protein YncE